MKVYGWKTDKPSPESLDLPVEQGYPMLMCWVTDRFLKVRHGPWLSNEPIVRFNDADQAWTELLRNERPELCRSAPDQGSEVICSAPLRSG